jgi:hypothetical protein
MQRLRIELSTAENFKLKHLSSYKNFLKKAAAESKTQKILVNMGDEEPSGLLYLIDEERGEYRRWTEQNGQIAILYDNVTDRVVGISAVENSTLDERITSGGNRLWLDMHYREGHTVTNYLLNSNLNWTKSQDKIGMMLTFNEYNKGIYTIICKASASGKKLSSFGNFWSDWWGDCVPLVKPIMLHNTPQWAVIKPVGNKDEVKALANALIEEYAVE